MPKVKVKQDGKDGKGKPLTISGKSVRIKAKEVQTDKVTTIKVTGKQSGAVSYIDLAVYSGKIGKGFSPPPITKLTNPNVPVADFKYVSVSKGK